MPDPDIGQLAAFLGAPHRVGEAQVGVADHAEYVRDPERDQRLDQHVGDGPRLRRGGGKAHVDAVRALIDLVCGTGASEKPSGGVPVSGS